MVDASGFRNAIDAILVQSEDRGLSFVDIRSGDLHRKVGGYPGPSHRMPICCSVMRSIMGSNDVVIQSPPKGNGATLVIRYSLPREQGMAVGHQVTPEIPVKSEISIKPDSPVIARLKDLSRRNEELADLDNLGEMAAMDARSAITKIRMISEKIARKICKKSSIPYEGKSFNDLCQTISDNRLLSAKGINYLHNIRKMGNEAAHNENEIFVEQDAMIIAQAMLAIVEEGLDKDLF